MSKTVGVLWPKELFCHTRNDQLPIKVCMYNKQFKNKTGLIFPLLMRINLIYYYYVRFNHLKHFIALWVKTDKKKPFSPKLNKNDFTVIILYHYFIIRWRSYYCLVSSRKFITSEIVNLSKTRNCWMKMHKFSKASKSKPDS